MAREFAKAFYNSEAWKTCKKRYIQLMPRNKRGLCEKCFEKGSHIKGDELHHKIWLNPDNINDSNITLNHNNLILLCRECHREAHGDRKPSQYVFNDKGEIVANSRYKAPIIKE